MKNETLERLRLPGAWALLAAAGVLMLSGLIQVIVLSSSSDWHQGTSFASAMYGAGAAHFFGVGITLLVAAAVLLVLTSDGTRPAASPVVLTAMIVTGVGLLFCLITVICGFIGAINAGHGLARMLETVAQGAVLGFVGFATMKAYNDPTLVPKAVPQPQGAYPQQFPPATGMQQSFAQPGYPAQDPSAQAPADPAQAYGQQYGTDAGAQQQYGTGAQQAYGQQYGADASGQQAAYGQQYGADAGAQQGYDPAQAYGQQYGADAGAQQQYGTGAQQAYGQQYGADASGQQAAYGQQYGADAGAQQGYDPAQAYGQQYGTDAGAQQQYGTGAQQAYGQQYGADAGAQQQYGTGAQQAYGQQYGADASGQQAAYGQQGEYSYDSSQYAPQSTEQQTTSGEQAAQDAIQYGWYQGADQGQQAQSAPAEGGLDPFFNSGENTGNETPGQGGGSYGSQYGSGTGYGSDQQGQSGSGGQQGWYGNDDQR